MTLTPIGLALDYSQQRLTGAQIRSAGYHGVIRYLPKPSPSSVATLTKAEYADLTLAGLAVGIVFEHNDRLRPLQGRSAGVDDGQWALRMCREESLPVPPRCVLMAHDIWESQYRTGDGLAAMRAYQAGARSVLGGVAGVYGYREIIDAARQDGTASRFWQCGRESDVAPHVNVYQQNYGQITLGGITCDVNKILTPDWGQHPAPANPDPGPAGHDSKDDDMNLIYETDGPRILLLQGGRCLHLVDPHSAPQIQRAANYGGRLDLSGKEIDNLLAASK